MCRKTTPGTGTVTDMKRIEMKFAVTIQITTLALALSFAARADEPWKSKSYKEWNDKEVARIFTDSPWTRKVLIPAPWREGSGGGALSRSGRGRGSGTAAGSDEGQAEGSPGGDPVGQTSPQMATALYYIRWTSARTFRQAWVREPLTQGKVKEAEVEKFLAQQPEEYEIVVVGTDMVPFMNMKEAVLKQTAYLRPRKSKEKIYPSRVELRRAGEGRRGLSVVFHFPKKTQTGEPVVSAEEKAIEFTCRGDDAILSSNFDLQKMVNHEGLDL